MCLICLSALLILTTGCSNQDGEKAVSSDTDPLAGSLPSEASSSVAQSDSKAPSDNGNWVAYIDDDHNLCIKKKDDSKRKKMIQTVTLL